MNAGEVADFLGSVAGIDCTAFGVDDAIALLQTHSKVAAWMASMEADLLVAAASPAPRVEDYALLLGGSDEHERQVHIADIVREEIASALRWSPTTAQSRIDTARLLHGPLAEAKRALTAGEITYSHVNAMVDEVRRLPGFAGDSPDDVRQFRDACSRFQSLVLPTARAQTLARTRAAARRAVRRIDAVGHSRRREAARPQRNVWIVDELDGHSTLSAYLLTEHAHAILAAVNSQAECLAPDADAQPARYVGERRTQALLELVCQTGGNAASRASARSAHVDVVVDLDTLLALSDGRAELRGARGGSLGSDAVRELMADPEVAVTIRRLVTDPLTGALLDVGRRSYRVPARMRELIAVRDGVCRFPGCERRARKCQIDHAVAWEDGGRTDRSNLGALCVRHHQLKTHAGWTITNSRSDGSCVWTSPFGRRYEHRPEPALP